MCQECIEDAIASGASDETVEFLRSLFAPMGVVDYFEEYRTESEADLTGESEFGPWKVSAAKVGGGSVGKEYPAGEDWILQAYDNGVLVGSKVAAPPYAVTHEQALREAAEYWFDYQG